MRSDERKLRTFSEDVLNEDWCGTYVASGTSGFAEDKGMGDYNIADAQSTQY